MADEAKVILVTGGSGLVGSAIKQVAATNCSPNEKWIFLGSKDGDLSDAKITKELFAKHRPTHVIHLAAMVGGLYFQLKNNLEIMRKNLHINDAVLHTCYELKVKKVVSCLSTCIYPDDTTYPLEETMLHNGPPHSSNFGYSMAKRLVVFQNHAYHRDYACKFTSIVPCNIFGPGDNFDLINSHVIPGLIRKLYDVMNEGTDPAEQVFRVMGSGKPLRQFIYSLDLARLIIWALYEYEEIDPINCCVDETDEITIKQLAEEIVRAFNFKGKVVFDTSKSDGQFKKTVSNKKLRKYLPNFKFTDFSVAIKDTVEWYKKNAKTARN